MLNERFFASLILTISVIITIAIAPIVFGQFMAYSLYPFLTHWLFIVMVVVASIVGFLLHPDDAFKIISHLWYTEKPHNAEITVNLWVFLIVIGLASLFMSA